MTPRHSEKPGENVKRFHLNRLVDESGMSGLGVVSEGVVLPNGIAVMWWLVPPHSVQIYPSVEDLHRIHRHGNRKTTELVWDSTTPNIPPFTTLDVTATDSCKATVETVVPETGTNVPLKGTNAPIGTLKGDETDQERADEWLATLPKEKE